MSGERVAEAKQIERVSATTSHVNVTDGKSVWLELSGPRGGFRPIEFMTVKQARDLALDLLQAVEKLGG